LKMNAPRDTDEAMREVQRIRDEKDREMREIYDRACERVFRVHADLFRRLATHTTPPK
jgi:hypothetical protein